MINYKITSFDLKLALLQYFRFKRGWLCVTEFRGADVITDTGKEIIEIEIKITKPDLINGERKKSTKHHSFKMGFGYGQPNKYLFCVPERLVKTALDWAIELNTNYGIIGFDEEGFLKRIEDNASIWHCTHLRYVKSAKQLHTRYNDNIRWAIAKRASSEIARLTTNIFHQSRCRALGAQNDKVRGLTVSPPK